MWLPLLLAAFPQLPRTAGEALVPGGEPDLYVPARRWALVIGASEYPYLGKLSFAARDAGAFSDSLIEHFGFEAETVSLLTDDAEDPRLRPTAGNMFLALRTLLANPRLQESDLFVFYFAGHGIGDESGDYLLPLDAALETVTDVGLHVEDVVAELTRAGMSNVLFVVDGCRTGNENTFGREFWQLAEEANLAVVLSCEPGQQSFEDRRLGGGVFTHFLVESLEDAGLVDERSGALWASRVAARAREKVEAWTSRGFDGRQVPQVWTDPTRDVLLGAELPDAAESLVGVLQSEVEGLDPLRYLAAVGRYAELLSVAERFEECAELLKAAEQMGELPPQLLYLLADSLQHQGRLVEMARVQDRLRTADPDSFYTLVAIAHDLSGETSAGQRYRASRRILSEHGVESEDLALLVAFNMVNGAPHEEARRVLAELLPRFVEGTRGRAYAQYMALLLDGEYDRALELLERAEELPGGYPGNWRMRVERLGLLREARRDEEVLEVLDRCIADWPEEGDWRARRAYFRFRHGDWAAARADAAVALGLELRPWNLLMAVRAAGVESSELHDAVAECAARRPLSWEAQLALALSTADAREAQALLDEAKRLAPRLGTWSATVAAIQYERGCEAFARDMVDGRDLSDLRYSLLEVLARRAAELDQGEGWSLLCELASLCSRQMQLAALLELHLGDAIDAGELQGSLLARVSMAFLDVGQLERYREVIAQAGPRTGLARRSAWIEVAWLVCAGRDEEARALVKELPPAGPASRGLELRARASLAARAGDVEAARELLAEAPAVAPGEGAAAVLAGLTHEALGDTDEAERAFAPLLGTTGAQPFFARAAAWRALAARELEPQVREGLAFVAGRDGLANPLVADLSFAAQPGVEGFLGTVEFDLRGDGAELDASGASLLLSVRRGGKVSGIIERPGGDVWSLKGTIDAHGNLEAQLLGAPRTARVFAKLAPPEVYESCAPLAEHGLLLQVMDADGNVSGWSAYLRP